MLQHSPQRWPSTCCAFWLVKVKVRCVGHLTHTIWYIVGAARVGEADKSRGGPQDKSRT